MAFNWKEFAVNMILPTAEALAEPQIETLLNKVAALEATADGGADNFAIDLQVFAKMLARIKNFAEQSETKIDDGILQIFIDATKAVAITNGVDLDAPTALRTA